MAVWYFAFSVNIAFVLLILRKILGHVHKRDELTVIEARGPPGRGEETLQLM